MGSGKFVSAEANAELLVKVAGQHVDGLELFLKEAAPGLFDRFKGMFGRNKGPQPTLDPQVLRQGKEFVPNTDNSSSVNPAPNPYMGGRKSTVVPEMAGGPMAGPGTKMTGGHRDQLGPKLLGTMNAIADACKAVQAPLMQVKKLRKTIAFHFSNFQNMVNIFRQQFPGDPLGAAVQKEFNMLAQQMDFNRVDPAFAANKIRESAQRLSQQLGVSAKGTMPDMQKMFPTKPGQAVPPIGGAASPAAGRVPPTPGAPAMPAGSIAPPAPAVGRKAADTDLGGVFVRSAGGWSWKLATADQQIEEAVREFVLASTELLSDRQGTLKLAQSIPNLTSPVKNFHGNEADVEVGGNDKREIGYSAQTHAAEELNAKLKDLQQNISGIRAAYDGVKQMLQNIRDTFHPDFNSALHPATHKNGRELLGGAATKLLQTMPPVEDMNRVVQWAKVVEQHIGQQVGSLMNSTRVVDQRNTLRRFWDKSFGKALGKPNAPAAPAPAAAPASEKAASGEVVLWKAF